jgi:hypothetical protein
MNPGLYACLIGALVLGVLLSGWTPRQDTAPHLWPSVVGLGGITVGLLAVGLVSGTLVRHLVQVTPPALALALVVGGSPLGRAAGLSRTRRTVTAMVFGALQLSALWVSLQPFAFLR